MMIRKYKIGNFVVEIKSRADFQDVEPYSLFLYEGEHTDYYVNVYFTSDLPLEIENPCCDSQDWACVCEDNELSFYYKSHDRGVGFYACSTKRGKNIDIAIDEEYHDMLWTRVIFHLIGIESLVAENNGCVLHSSFIEKEGRAVLFTGPCSVGKSTQAGLWKKYADAEIINGDKTLVFEENGVFYASGLPFSGSSKDCLNKVLPLGAVICLQQAPENTAQRLESNDAFYKFYKNCYPVSYSRECTGNELDLAIRLSQKVPVYEYACLADESAVRCLERELCPVLQSL
mgnify:CR=1 FL=1